MTNPTTMPAFDSYFQTLGLSRFEENLGPLFNAAEAWAHAAGTGSGCDLLPSGIEALAVPPTPNSKVLVVDIGGTHTKVALRLVDSSGAVSWVEVLDRENAEFQIAGDTHSFQRFCQSLMAETRAALKSSIFADQQIKVDGLATVWSNGMSAAEAVPNYTGNSGIVSSRARSYHKKEWFIEDLVDGEDLGKFLLPAFENEGMYTDAFLIGNDTTFAHNTLPGAHGGMVCATGGNSTLRRGAKIFNGETGGTFLVPEEYLTEAEQKYFRRTQQGPEKDREWPHLEKIATGPTYAVLFYENALALAENGDLGLRDLHSTLQQLGPKRISPSTITLLAKGDFEAFKAKASLTNEFDASQLQFLRALAQKMEVRAGQAAAIIAYMSIADQITTTPQNFVVAQDSIFARNSAFFAEAQAKAFAEALPGTNSRIITMSPQGKISVPMLGAANSIDGLLAQRN